jgi:hypothetical protein
MIAQQTAGVGKKDCTFEQFEAAREASFKHHWNNHQHCGEWCQPKSWREEEKVEKSTSLETRSRMKKNTSSN